jgi:hypothetical protein
MVSSATMEVLIHALSRASTDNVWALSHVGSIFVPVCQSQRFPADSAAHVYKSP